MRFVKTILVGLFTATMFVVPITSAQAVGDCVVDDFSNGAGSDTDDDRTFRFCMTDAAGAAAGETITFNHGNSQQTIELASSTVDSVNRTGSVTIDGEGFATLTLANGQSGFRMIETSADIEVIGMKFRDGNADQGSVIHTTGGGIVTVRNSTFTDNEATVTGSEINNLAQGGGAIDGSGDVLVYDSTFSGNTSGRDGGAILAEGDVTVEGSTFTSNIAADDGGAIYSRIGDITVRDNSTFTGNKATEDGGTSYISNGGALYTSGGDSTSSADIQVFDSTFTGNEADDDGGAIKSADRGETSRFEDSTFTSNSAGLDGGAVYVDNFYSLNHRVAFQNCTFSSNISGAAGGAIYVDEAARIEDSTFTSNSAVSDGGAVYAEDDDVLIFDSLFELNTSTGDGGAIFADNDFDSTRSSFVSNSGVNGGAVMTKDDIEIEDSYFGLNSATGDGGAIRIEDALYVENSTFYDNDAGGRGGAFWTKDGETTSSAYIIYSTFIDNTADTEGTTLYFQATNLFLFANLMISSQDSEQITGDTDDLVDYGANVSSFENETVFDNATSVKGVALSALEVTAPLTATETFQPTVRFGALARSEAKVTQDLIDSYELARSTTLPSSDQLGTTRSAPFFAGAEFVRWRSASPAPYLGPIITDVGGNGIAAPFSTFEGETVRVVGERLSTVSKVFVDDKEGEVISTADNQFIMTVPEGVSAGTHDLKIQSSIGNLTYLDGFVVSSAGADNAAANAVCEGAEPSWWTKRISDTQAKAYIKCPEVGQKYEITHQTGGSGGYDGIFAKTLASIDDETQIFSDIGRYIVRTIDLEDVNRIRISVDGEKLWQVRYNNPPAE